MDFFDEEDGFIDYGGNFPDQSYGDNYEGCQACCYAGSQTYGNEEYQIDEYQEGEPWYDNLDRGEYQLQQEYRPHDTEAHHEDWQEAPPFFYFDGIQFVDYSPLDDIGRFEQGIEQAWYEEGPRYELQYHHPHHDAETQYGRICSPVDEDDGFDGPEAAASLRQASDVREIGLPYYNGNLREDYEVIGRGINDQGNDWAERDYGPTAPYQNTFCYGNDDDALYYEHSKPDGLTYYDDENGKRLYMPPNGSQERREN